MCDRARILVSRYVASSLLYAVWRPSSCSWRRHKVKIFDYKENLRLTNGLLKLMIHWLTVCPNAITVDAYVLTVVYICFIKKAKAVKSQFV